MFLLWMHTKFSCVLLLGGNVPIMDAYKVFLCSLTWRECSYYECIQSFLVFSYLVVMFLFWMDAYKVFLFSLTWRECSYYGCIQNFLVFSYLVVMFLFWMHTKFSCVLLLGGNVPIMDAYKVFLCSLTWWECSYYGCIQSFLVFSLLGGNVPIMDAYKVFLCSLPWWECSYYGCIQSFLVFSYLVGMFLLWMHTKFSLFSYLVEMFLLWMHTKFSCVLLLGGNVPIMDAYKVFLCPLTWWECYYYGCIQSVLVFSYLAVMFLLWMHTKFSCVLLLGGNVPIMDAYKVFLCSLTWWECSYYGCIQFSCVLLLGGNVPIMNAYKVFLCSLTWW